MFKRNQIQKSLVVAGVTLASFAAFSQQNETTTASVTVQNAFTLTEDAALSFGTITANVVSGTDGTLTVNPDGTQGQPAGGIRVLVPGTAASYTIAGAAPFTDLKINTNVDTVDLINSAAPPGSPQFTLSAFQVTDGTVTESINSGASAFTAGDFQTDVGGTLTVGLGGTLTLPGGPAELLIDGNYEGNFTITVSY